MKSLLLVLICLLSSLTNLKAQENINAANNSIEKLKFIVGTWEGEGWMMTQTGKEFTRIKETASCKAGCTVLAIEGLGIKTNPDTKEETIVHDAFGVMYLDKKTNALMMRAYKDGNENESVVEFIEEKKIRWVLDIPNGSKVRFTADYTIENKWTEIGEFSRDGENWMQFLGMELTKLEN